MKKIIPLLLLIFSINVQAQELNKPSEGKAMVYFTRVEAMGFLINFKYFDGEKYLGKFNYGKYLAYECDPGKHLFWAKSENSDFVEAELEPNKIYILDSQPQMGAFKAGVKLIPFNNDPTFYKNEKKYNRIKTRMLESITSGESYSMSEEDVKEAEQDLQELTKRIMEKYDKKKTENEVITQMPKEMFFQ
jgi:hypothetical protein